MLVILSLFLHFILNWTFSCCLISIFIDLQQTFTFRTLWISVGRPCCSFLNTRPRNVISRKVRSRPLWVLLVNSSHLTFCWWSLVSNWKREIKATAQYLFLKNVLTSRNIKHSKKTAKIIEMSHIMRYHGVIIMYKGCSIHRLQNDAILLIFKVWKVQNIFWSVLLFVVCGQKNSTQSTTVQT